MKTNLLNELIFTVDNILSPEECVAWIDSGENKGFKPSPARDPN